MKILQYNIWNGCRDQERYEKLKAFLMNQSYEMIGFNELKYWTETEFIRSMEKCGYDHYAFLKIESSLHSIGFASKYPVEIINMTEEDPFHHGLLHVKSAEINFVITHLSPHSAEHRERETLFIADYVKKIKGSVLMMGDLNTLSPLDDKFYTKTNIIDDLKRSERAKKCHVKNGNINYQPMENLLTAGLQDLGSADYLDYSMPTKVFSDFKNRRHVRIDYILGNERLLKYNPRAHVIRSTEVEKISDHYPIECELDEF